MTEEMRALSLRWQEVFGTGMPYGFEVTDEDAPIIRQCIEERSERPLNDLVKRRVGDRQRIY